MEVTTLNENPLRSCHYPNERGKRLASVFFSPDATAQLRDTFASAPQARHIPAWAEAPGTIPP